MIYELPTSVTVGGVEYAIRSEYGAALDICAALFDPELNDEDKSHALLDIFYPDFDAIPPKHYEEAIKQCFWFINCANEEPQRKAQKLMDWEQDFSHVVGPINRVLGKEIRTGEYLHWWTFISAYYEIGDCTFAQIVRIRDRLARNKPLDKSDREWYNRNRHLVDFKAKYTEAEDELLKLWGGG